MRLWALGRHMADGALACAHLPYSALPTYEPKRAIDHPLLEGQAAEGRKVVGRQLPAQDRQVAPAEKNKEGASKDEWQLECWTSCRATRRHGRPGLWVRPSLDALGGGALGDDARAVLQRPPNEDLPHVLAAALRHRL